MKQPFSTLLKLQSQYYFQNLGKTLRQYRLWIFLFLVLVASGINYLPNPLYLGMPLVDGINLNASISQTVSLIILTQAIGAVWYLSQAPFLEHRPFECYLNTLVISDTARKLNQIIILCISDTLLWVPVICAIWLAFTRSGGMFAYWSELIRLGGLCWLMILFQFCLLTKQYRKLVWVILLNVGFSLINWLPFYLNVLGALVIDIIGLWICFSKSKAHPKLSTLKLTSKCLNLLPADWQIEWQIIVQYKTNFLMRFTVTVALQALLYEFIKHTTDFVLVNQTWSYFVIFNALTCFVLSGLSKSFSLEHNKALEYLKVFGITKGYWFLRDFLVIIVTSLIVQVPLLSYGLGYGLLNSKNLLILIVMQIILMLGLLALNRAPWAVKTQVFAIIIWTLLLIYIPITSLN